MYRYLPGYSAPDSVNSVSQMGKKRSRVSSPPHDRLCSICDGPFTVHGRTTLPCCKQSLCMCCFLQNSCPTGPTADTNERNRTTRQATQCVFCKAEYPDTLSECVTDRCNSYMRLPVHDAEFRLMHTNSMLEVFAKQIPCSENEAVKMFCMFSGDKRKVLDALQAWRDRMTDKFGPMEFWSDPKLLGVLTSPWPQDPLQLDERLEHLVRRMYEKGLLTPSLLLYLHKHWNCAVGGVSLAASIQGQMDSVTMDAPDRQILARAAASMMQHRLQPVQLHLSVTEVVDML